MNDIDDNNDRRRFQMNPNDRFSGGFVFLLVGGALLARQLGAPLPDWLFTWPMIPILVGLHMGLKLWFRNPGWLIPFVLGLVFLMDQILPEINLKPFLLPAAFIAIGLLFMFRPRHNRWRNCNVRSTRSTDIHAVENNADITEAFVDKHDFIDSTSVFGGVKKIVLSKNFQGGDITNFMGGSEINLSQADFKGRVRIDTTNIFGGTKLIVPAHWDVQSDIVAVFGGVDDKRRFLGVTLDPDKVVVLDGTCLFGGIEIHSY